MWGLEGAAARVFVENKFWAGLTANQPVAYLEQLAGCEQPSVLLPIAPAARAQTLWRELTRRLRDASVETSDLGAIGALVQAVATSLGPVLALTSWSRVLEVVEQAAADGDPGRLQGLDVPQRGAPVHAQEAADVAVGERAMAGERVEQANAANGLGVGRHGRPPGGGGFGQDCRDGWTAARDRDTT